MREREDAENSDSRRKNSEVGGHCSGFKDIDTTSDIALDGYLTIRNVQYSHPPSKKICKLAISTFEKMKLTQLKQLEKLNEDLKVDGRISVDKLVQVTSKIITEVWECPDAFTNILNSDKRLAVCFGKEMLVLYDNVMLDPVYAVTETGRSQRYTKACLDNSIRPLYDDDVPKNRWNTYETVISTYTSPTAFTPEMESLMKHAARLGISTENCNLKNFATERSMSAFLKKLINAKLKKEAFIEKFNNKLMGVLSHSPNPTEAGGLENKFKYSFSKIYQFAQQRQETKSSTDICYSSRRPNPSNILRKTEQNKFQSYDNCRRNRFNDGVKFTHSARFGYRRDKLQNHGRYDLTVDSVCHKCHGPFRDDQMKECELTRSWSDSCLSVASFDTVDSSHLYDSSKIQRPSGDLRPAPMTSTSSYRTTSRTFPKTFRKVQNNEVIKRKKISIEKLQSKFPKETNNFSLLTEQRSFFRLGEGALRDSLNQYVEAKDKGASKKILKKKRVRWLDEPHPSLETFYGSLFDLSSEKSDKEETDLHQQSITNWETFINLLLGSRSLIQPPLEDERVLFQCDKSMRRAFTQAVLQATAIALTFWLAFVLYFRTPEIAYKLRNLRFTSVIIRLFKE